MYHVYLVKIDVFWATSLAYLVEVDQSAAVDKA